MSTIEIPPSLAAANFWFRIWTQRDHSDSINTLFQALIQNPSNKIITPEGTNHSGSSTWAIHISFRKTQIFATSETKSKSTYKINRRTNPTKVLRRQLVRLNTPDSNRASPVIRLALQRGLYEVLRAIEVHFRTFHAFCALLQCYSFPTSY